MSRKYIKIGKISIVKRKRDTRLKIKDRLTRIYNWRISLIIIKDDYWSFNTLIIETISRK